MTSEGLQTADPQTGDARGGETALDMLREAAEGQQAAAAAVAAPAYVLACPGAGKTHVVATRHLQ